MARAIIAMIGTREMYKIPEHICNAYWDGAVHAAERGFTIVTGAAVGADQNAADYALRNGGTVELVLPWPDYEEDWIAQRRATYGMEHLITLAVYNRSRHTKWTESVDKHHPNPKALTYGGKALHARNYGIIERCTSVIAIPDNNKPGGGGTGQGIRVARALGKPVFDLTNPADYRKLITAIQKGRNK